MERAVELLSEAQDLLMKESYKSANNRAFYSIEKSIKALLAIVGKEVQTHSGGLKQFNFEFICFNSKYIKFNISSFAFLFKLIP